jgi:hypothetical protein
LRAYLYGGGEPIRFGDLPLEDAPPHAVDQRFGAQAHNLTAEGSTPSPATTPSAITPLRRHVVLHRDFDLDAHNILDYAEHQLLEGEALDLDHVADLIANKVREHLHVVYGPGEER